jgi:hypothetical protein
MISWPTIPIPFIPGRSNILAGLAGLFLGSVAGFGLILRAHRTSPIIIYSAYELDGVVQLGGHLDLLFDVDRTRDCPSQTSRWLWTWVKRDNNFVRQYFPLSNSNASITEAGSAQKFILSMQCLLAFGQEIGFTRQKRSNIAQLYLASKIRRYCRRPIFPCGWSMIRR